MSSAISEHTSTNQQDKNQVKKQQNNDDYINTLKKNFNNIYPTQPKSDQSLYYDENIKHDVVPIDIENTHYINNNNNNNYQPNSRNNLRNRNHKYNNAYQQPQNRSYSFSHIQNKNNLVPYPIFPQQQISSQQSSYMPQFPPFIPFNQYNQVPYYSPTNFGNRRKSQSRSQPQPQPQLQSQSQSRNDMEYNNGQHFYIPAPAPYPVPMYYPQSNSSSPQIMQNISNPNMYYPIQWYNTPNRQYQPTGLTVSRTSSSGNFYENPEIPAYDYGNAENDEAVYEDDNDENGNKENSDIEHERQDDTLVVTLNLLNLPAIHTTVDSINTIITNILQNENEYDSSNLPIKNIKIYKYNEQSLCWSSLQLTDHTKLDLLITKLNEYEFNGSILKCFVQPPPKVQNTSNNKHSYNRNYNKRSHAQSFSYSQFSYQQQQQQQQSMTVPYGGYSPSTLPALSLNNNISNKINGAGYQRYHNNSRQHNNYKKPGYNQRSKPLGNNYNSIVFPDLDDTRIPNSSSSNNNSGISLGLDDDDYNDEDLIDDNELSTEELKQFNEFRHVSKDRIFIGNIPFNSTYHSLWLFLTNGGDNILIKELQLKTDSNGVSRGFAVCITKDEESSLEMIEQFNGKEFENRKLIVRFDKHNGLIFKSHMKKKLDILNANAANSSISSINFGRNNNNNNNNYSEQ